MFGFLQNCSKCNFHNELELLGHDLPQHDHLQEEQQDELQTDGNRCSYLGREERGRRPPHLPPPQHRPLLSPVTLGELVLGGCWLVACKVAVGLGLIMGWSWPGQAGQVRPTGFLYMDCASFWFLCIHLQCVVAHESPQ